MNIFSASLPTTVFNLSINAESSLGTISSTSAWTYSIEKYVGRVLDTQVDISQLGKVFKSENLTKSEWEWSAAVEEHLLVQFTEWLLQLMVKSN